MLSKKTSQIQDRLQISMIMTARSDLLTCKVDDELDINSEDIAGFTYLPVLSKSEEFVGLIDISKSAKNYKKKINVSANIIPISEKILIGGDASIFEYIKTADTNQAKLVISKNAVSGLVTLADIQRLPARISIFSLLTTLEIKMAKLIEQSFVSEDDWMQMLKKDRRDLINEQYRTSLTNDGFINRLELTSIKDKADVIANSDLVNYGSRTALKKAFFNLYSLRNSIAHSSEFAHTHSKAISVCKTVRKALQIIELL